MAPPADLPPGEERRPFGGFNQYQIGVGLPCSARTFQELARNPRPGGLGREVPVEFRRKWGPGGGSSGDLVDWGCLEGVSVELEEKPPGGIHYEPFTLKIRFRAFARAFTLRASLTTHQARWDIPRLAFQGISPNKPETLTAATAFGRAMVALIHTPAGKAQAALDNTERQARLQAQAATRVQEARQEAERERPLEERLLGRERAEERLLGEARRNPPSPPPPPPPPPVLAAHTFTSSSYQLQQMSLPFLDVTQGEPLFVQRPFNAAAPEGWWEVRRPGLSGAPPPPVGLVPRWVLRPPLVS